MGRSFSLKLVLVTVQVELLTSFPQNIDHVGSGRDFDFRPSQVRREHFNVRRHTGGLTMIVGDNERRRERCCP